MGKNVSSRKFKRLCKKYLRPRVGKENIFFTNNYNIHECTFKFKGYEFNIEYSYNGFSVFPSIQCRKQIPYNHAKTIEDCCNHIFEYLAWQASTKVV